MEIIPPYLRIYQQILKDLENAFPFLNVPKPKAGRKPKLTDILSNYGLVGMASILLKEGIGVEELVRRVKDGIYSGQCLPLFYICFP